jgi:hypothetical protein
VRKTLSLLFFMALLAFSATSQAATGDDASYSQDSSTRASATHRFRATLPTKQGQVFTVDSGKIWCTGKSSAFQHDQAVFPVFCSGNEIGSAKATVKWIHTGRHPEADMTVDFADGKSIGYSVRRGSLGTASQGAHCIACYKWHRGCLGTFVTRPHLLCG